MNEAGRPEPGAAGFIILPGGQIDIYRFTDLQTWLWHPRIIPTFHPAAAAALLRAAHAPCHLSPFKKACGTVATRVASALQPCRKVATRVASAPQGYRRV
ncbi:MAG: hypothetical protein LBI89_00845, partial [Prevotellaceae bacterium]|nr:hypothetical protein [Prevotellaceae bacterium]